MPRDDWKRARDNQHAQRSRFQFASGAAVEYEHSWDDGTHATKADGISARSAEQGTTEPLQPAFSGDNPSEMRRYLRMLRGSPLQQTLARKYLTELCRHDAASVAILINNLQAPEPTSPSILEDALVSAGRVAVAALLELHRNNERQRAAVIRVLQRMGDSMLDVVRNEIRFFLPDFQRPETNAQPVLERRSMKTKNSTISQLAIQRIQHLVQILENVGTKGSLPLLEAITRSNSPTNIRLDASRAAQSIRAKTKRAPDSRKPR